MTNSYSLSLRPKLVFIHGLNNNLVAFGPLMDHFKNLGFETELIVLPGHGNDRKSITNLEGALESFNRSLMHLKGQPYYAVAFSHGALYLELWLNKYQTHPPIKKILLAPALHIRRYKLLRWIFTLLPSFFMVKSFSPKDLRRYQVVTAREYRILMDGIETYQNISDGNVPGIILIDPKDELVDAQKLQKLLKNVEFIERPNLKNGLGLHHIIFHPKYFTNEEWRNFTRKIEIFLEV